MFCWKVLGPNNEDVVGVYANSRKEAEKIVEGLGLNPDDYWVFGVVYHGFVAEKWPKQKQV